MAKILKVLIYTTLSLFIWQKQAFSFQYQGKIKYRKSYSLYLYKIDAQLGAEGRRQITVIKSLLYDELRLVRFVINDEAVPSEIIYPHPPLKGEDPREQFLNKNRRPRKFELKIVEARSPPPTKHAENAYHLSVKASKKKEGFITLYLNLYYEQKILLKQSFDLRQEELARDIQPVSAALRKALAKGEITQLSIATNERGASVYLDSVYLGKTPVQFANMPLGAYTLSIGKQGYEKIKRQIQFTKKKTKMNFNLKKAGDLGQIEVITDPPGVSVYLGIEYVGKSPITIKEVEPGSHRIKVKKEGYVTFYRSTDITKKKSRVKLKIAMAEGDTATYYKGNPPILGSITYKHMYIGATVSTIVFLGGSLLFNVLSNSATNKLTAQQLGRGADAEYIKSQQDKINQFNVISSGFLLLSALAAGLGVFMFYKYLKSFDNEIVFLRPGNETMKNHSYHLALNQSNSVHVSMKYHF